MLQISGTFCTMVDMETTDWTNRLRASLKESDKGQDDLAEELGVTRGAIGHYMSGRRMPSLDLAGKLAETLSISLNWLLLGKGPKSMADAVGKQYSSQINKNAFKIILDELNSWLDEKEQRMRHEDQIDFAIAAYNHIVKSDLDENDEVKVRSTARSLAETALILMGLEHFKIKDVHSEDRQAVS
ncbi:MAG: helix-turn-helix transcriptional regulator [Magnetococcales bacterium]|nr:helix-turn-helix transcriptional regulator [Magnetococcales bacterium]